MSFVPVRCAGTCSAKIGMRDRARPAPRSDPSCGRCRSSRSRRRRARCRRPNRRARRSTSSTCRTRAAASASAGSSRSRTRSVSSRSHSTMRSPVVSSTRITANWFSASRMIRSVMSTSRWSSSRADPAAVVVGAGHADVLARRPRLAHVHIAVAVWPPQRIAPLSNPHLRERAERLRIAGQQVDEVHRVRADADDVPAIVRSGHGSRSISRHRTGSEFRVPGSAFVLVRGSGFRFGFEFVWFRVRTQNENEP